MFLIISLEFWNRNSPVFSWHPQKSFPAHSQWVHFWSFSLQLWCCIVLGRARTLILWLWIWIPWIKNLKITDWWSTPPFRLTHHAADCHQKHNQSQPHFDFEWHLNVKIFFWRFLCLAKIGRLSGEWIFDWSSPTYLIFEVIWWKWAKRDNQKSLRNCKSV